MVLLHDIICIMIYCPPLAQAAAARLRVALPTGTRGVHEGNAARTQVCSLRAHKLRREWVGIATFLPMGGKRGLAGCNHPRSVELGISQAQVSASGQAVPSQCGLGHPL